MISSFTGSRTCLALGPLLEVFDRFVVVLRDELFFFVDVVRFVLPDVFFPEEVVLLAVELFPVPFPLLRVVLEAI